MSADAQKSRDTDFEPASDQGERLERAVHLTDLRRRIAGRLHPAHHRSVQNDAITGALRILGGHRDVIARTEAWTRDDKIAHFAGFAHHRNSLHRTDRLADGVDDRKADDAAGTS